MTENKDMTKVLGERRRFTIEQADGSKKEYFLGIPTAEDIRVADWEHAKAYNRALREDIFTTAEMMTILESRNIAGPDYDKVAEDLGTRLSEKLIDMEKETDEDERLKKAIEVTAIRNEVYRWNSRVSGPLSSTCESIANDTRVEYLTSAIIQDAQGNRIWKDFEEYKREGFVVQAKAKFEVMMWMEGLEPNVLENSPEALIIKESMAKKEAEKKAAEEKEKVPKEESDEVPTDSDNDKEVSKPRKKRASKKPTT